jgi:hypothetical protein
MVVMNDVAQNQAEPEDGEFPLPPPSFSFLVMALRAQAEVQLGIMHFGEDEQHDPNLELARHTIDLMVILKEKTKGNLALEEHRLLENSLTELQFRFSQISDDLAKVANQKA